MQIDLQFFYRAYLFLLRFYPRRYQEEYGEELQAVFLLSLQGAMKIGKLEVLRVTFLELISLPLAILTEHLRERRSSKMTENFSSRLDFAPGSRNEVLAALAPFLLFGALPTLLGYFRVADLVPLWLDIGFGNVLWLFGLSLILIGFVKRFPRWFMPYIGAPMPFFSLLLFIQLMEKWQGVWWYRLPWFLNIFIQEGLLWMGMVFMLVMLFVAARLVPKYRPFHQRLREDWTLLAFILYGATPLALVFTLDDYKNEEPYMFLALLILAAGGWLYLRSAEPWHRFFCLQGGMWLSMLVAAIGKAVLVESSFPGVPDDSWQIEFMSTIITGMWLALFMLSSSMLRWLPRTGNLIRKAW
jgi:hypothetical protein